MRNLKLSTNKPGFLNHTQTTVKGSLNTLSASVKFYSTIDENSASDKDDRKQESDISDNKISVTTGLPKFRKKLGNGALILDHFKIMKNFIQMEGEQEKNGLRFNKTSSLSGLLIVIIEMNRASFRTGL